MRRLLAGMALLMLSACALCGEHALRAAPERWELSTGSSISYLRIPARGGSRHAAPIIVLHGGPGAYAVTLEQTTRVLSRLSDSGRDVYFYDQVGSGLSERLGDITQYTVERHVADLEAIRTEVGAQRIVLIGSSWGATLAAHYAARYPDRVERMIVSGPGVIHPADWPDGYGRLEARFSAEETERFQAAVNLPRLEEALELLASDPSAAVRLFPDSEAGVFFDRVTNEFYIPHLGCDGARLDVISNGYGFWVNRMTGRDLNATADPKPRLSEITFPVLIVRGECEYMDRAVAEQYRTVFRNSTLIEIADAGHTIYWERPEEFLEVAVPFLGGGG